EGRLRVRAGQVFHDEVVQRGRVRVEAADLAGVDGRDDVRVPQLADRPHLGVEAGQEPGVLVAGPGQDLDGHPLAQADVFGQVNDGHAAGAEAVEDAVVAQHQAEALADPQAR